MARPVHVIGIMSGTSMDGVDCVLARMEQGRPLEISRSFVEYTDVFRAEMLGLNVPGADEMHRAALGANALAGLYGQAVTLVLAQAGLRGRDIAAIGAHGQTVRHRPDLGYTVQLLNGALLAELTGITTICDFPRPRHCSGRAGRAAGARLPCRRLCRTRNAAAPCSTLAASPMSTLLAAGGNDVLGFDCGPANVLMDCWSGRHLGTRYDADGAFAASGRVAPGLLNIMLAEPYFSAPPPKSTGRDLFSPHWLAGFDLEAHAPQDVQATLLELTAVTSAQAILAQGTPGDVLVCGGGALNGALMARLAQLVPSARVETTAACGIGPMSVEALAFAWLAWRKAGRAAGQLALRHRSAGFPGAGGGACMTGPRACEPDRPIARDCSSDR